MLWTFYATEFVSNFILLVVTLYKAEYAICIWELSLFPFVYRIYGIDYNALVFRRIFEVRIDDLLIEGR